jgi:hypothetical protein
MHVSPVAYRSNPQAFDVREKSYESAPQVAFTGSERPSYGSLSWGKRIIAGTMLGCATLFGAGTVMGQNTTKTDTDSSVDNKITAKPVVFAQQAFGIDGGSKNLTVAAINTKGNKEGYNAILCMLYSHSNETTTKWWVACLTEPAEGSRMGPRVVLAKLGDKAADPLSIYDTNVVKYVRGLIEDIRNLSGADIRKAGGKKKAQSE